MIPNHFKFGRELQNDDVTMHKALGVWNGVTELGKNARDGTVYERIPDHNCNSRRHMQHSK